MKAPPCFGLLLLSVILGRAADAGELAVPHRAVLTGDRVNVRGQATIHSEVITQLNTGDSVTVIEEIQREEPDEAEPAGWAKIRLPEGVTVWAASQYLAIDGDTGTVTPRRLNLRAGPGENYSILGRVEQGTTLNIVSSEGDWSEIADPPSAYAFVARKFLEMQGPAPESRVATPTSGPAPEPVEEVEESTVVRSAAPPQASDIGVGRVSVQPKPTGPGDEGLQEIDIILETPRSAENPTVVSIEDIDEEPILLGDDEIVPLDREPTVRIRLDQDKPETSEFGELGVPEEETASRLVRREGIVGSTISIQAPTYFRLKNIINKETMNYIKSGMPNLNLEDYKGRHIVVTGEEFVDPRWPRMPVLVIESLEALK